MEQKNKRTSFSSKKVANLAGVSQSTVSRVINNHDNVNPETKDKIIKIIKELNATPQQLARRAVGDSPYDIGLIVADVNNDFYAELTRLIVQRAEVHGSNVLVCNIDNNASMIDNYIHILLQKKISGVIFSAIPLHNRRLITMLKENFPCILCNRLLKEQETNYVICDNFSGGTLMMQHLFDLGHRKIGFITGPEATAIYTPRFDAYKKFFEDHNLEYDSQLVIHTAYQSEAANAAMRTLMKMPNPPTAVFCVNDAMAMGALDYAISSGRRVPQDVAVAGYDNTAIGAHSAMQLTTVDCSTAQQAICSVDGLLQLIKNPNKEIRIREIFAPQLIVRRTTAG